MLHSATDPNDGKVMVMDEDPIVRSAVRALMRSEGYAAEAFASAGALLEAKLPDGPCCIVTEARLDTLLGTEMLERLKGRNERIPVIFIARYPDIPMSVRAMKAGALDFLIKPLDDRILLDAVEGALDLDRMRRANDHRQKEMENRFGLLTARERQVMQGVVRGLMNKQIAWGLTLSEITVKIHRASLMRKMQVRSVADLVRASFAINKPEEAWDREPAVGDPQILCSQILGQSVIPTSRRTMRREIRPKID